MILEGLIENSLSGEIDSRIREQDGYKITMSRATVNEGEIVNEETPDFIGVIALASGFRRNSNFSLPTIDVNMAISIVTRKECDPTAQKHEALVEIIANMLSSWHKFPQQLSVLDNSKFKVGELFMNGGSGRIDNNGAWSDTINFSLRGSEIFSSNNSI